MWQWYFESEHDDFMNMMNSHGNVELSEDIVSRWNHLGITLPTRQKSKGH